MIKLALFGSTGSIGVQTLDIARRFPEEIKIVSLIAGSNAALLEEQARLFRPSAVSLASPPEGYAFDDLPGIEYIPSATPETMMRDADVVFNAVTGFAGLDISLAAARSGKRLCLANKESLVTAGQLVLREAKAGGATILPVDSEHAAIHQCLAGQPLNPARRLILTASGGPFRDWPLERMREATAAQALRHPNWAMGTRITIDSATMMNKALELIEAHYLFDVSNDQLDVLIHPQSIIHSMVEYKDGSVIAQLGLPDMRLPILYALTYPARMPLDLPPLDLAALGKLTFQPPDAKRFPALTLARQVLRAGGNSGAIFNAADEAAVERFLMGECGFLDIASTVEETLMQVPYIASPTLEDIRQSDLKARAVARNVLHGKRRTL